MSRDARTGRKTHLATFSACLLYAYWHYFFGEELLSTIRLYHKGRGIYEVLNDTKYANKYANVQPTLGNDESYNHYDLTTTSITMLFPSVPSPHSTIPLIMHRMWRDDHIFELNNHGVPENWRKAFHHCNEIYQKHNWTTILWTDASIRILIEHHYRSFLPLFDSYRYNIQRIDAARYFILYHYGGVYMDLDVGCQKHKYLGDFVRSMQELEKGALLPLTSPLGMSNDVMFASKKNPFFKELMDALPRKNRWYGSPYLTVMFSTGPMFLSLVYLSLSDVKRKEVLVLPPEMYSVKGTRYFKHLRGSTWHGSDARLGKWLMKNWAYIVIVVIFARLSWKRMKGSLSKTEPKECKPHRF